MPIAHVIKNRFHRSFQLFDDLLEALPEDALDRPLPRVRSNTVGGQLWCVVGARESYAKAITEGGWAGFSCSLAAVTDKNAVADALRTSARGVLSILDDFDQFSDAQYKLLIDLLEHEASHQGQLIRYMYGLSLAIPDSWRERYALKS